MEKKKAREVYRLFLSNSHHRRFVCMAVKGNGFPLHGSATMGALIAFQP